MKTNDTNQGLGSITSTIVLPYAGLMMTTEEIRNTIGDLLDAREDRETTEEYKQAFRTMDVDKLNYFQSMGGYARQQIMNVHEYRKGLVFGFNNVEFDEHGWIKHGPWNDVEITYIDQKNQNNYIKIGRGDNSCWTYGLWFNYSNGGACYGLSVYGPKFPTKEDARAEAMHELRGLFQKVAIETNGNKKDRAFAEHMLLCMDGLNCKEQQLTLF